MILGARLCGMAGPLIEPAMSSADEVIKTIERLRNEFITAMFLLGMSQVEELIGNQSLILNA
jgi:isopentenyl-diphosphate delta-isomerase